MGNKRYEKYNIVLNARLKKNTSKQDSEKYSVSKTGDAVFVERKNE